MTKNKSGVEKDWMGDEIKITDFDMTSAVWAFGSYDILVRYVGKRHEFYSKKENRPHHGSLYRFIRYDFRAESARNSQLEAFTDEPVFKMDIGDTTIKKFVRLYERAKELKVKENRYVIISR